MAYQQFGLTLMVTHACNMRCHYCYTGDKAARRMPPDVGDAAIRRAAASVDPGGTLEMGFFGGEPLLEATAIRRWIDVATAAARDARIRVTFQLTTNGTVTTPAAWSVLMHPDVQVAVSFDGLPEVHDRFRIYADGRGTAATVRQTIERLLAAGKRISAVMVVRPQTAGQLAAGARHLRAIGVRSIEPSLDLWTHWTRDDAAVLRRSIAELAEVWLEGLPHHALNWFDEKAVELSGVSSHNARCGFGDGQIAVAPSGNFYPCERLIGEDAQANPLRLPGHALDGGCDLSPHPHPAGKNADACHECSMNGMCNTYCRCSNFVRTGNAQTPDGLLCMLNQACLEEVAARMRPAVRNAFPAVPAHAPVAMHTPSARTMRLPVQSIHA